MGTAVKHPVPDRVKPSSVIFDIRALSPERQSARMSKNYKWRLKLAWHRMLYSCTHVSTMGVKGLNTMLIRSLTSSCWKADHWVAVSPVTDVVLERQEVKQQLRNRRHSSHAETRVQIHTELLHHKYVHQSVEKSTVDRGRDGEG